MLIYTNYKIGDVHFTEDINGNFLVDNMIVDVNVYNRLYDLFCYINTELSEKEKIEDELLDSTFEIKELKTKVELLEDKLFRNYIDNRDVDIVVFE